MFPDSSDHVCIEGSNIATGYDAIALKSGWDQYGIAYGRPSKNIHIRRVHLQSSSGSSIAFGSEMSGGISNVLVEHVQLHNSSTAIQFRTTKGRGGYIKGIVVSDVEMENISTAFSASGHFGLHPDDEFDPNALPIVQDITLQNVRGSNIKIAGNFSGIPESPFTSIYLSNITFLISSSSSSSWICSDVSGFSDSVIPPPCSDLSHPYSISSSAASPLLNSARKTAVL